MESIWAQRDSKWPPLKELSRKKKYVMIRSPGAEQSGQTWLARFWPLFATSPQMPQIKLFTGWSDFDADNGIGYRTSQSNCRAQLAKIFVRGFLHFLVDLLLRRPVPENRGFSRPSLQVWADIFKSRFFAMAVTPMVPIGNPENMSPWKNSGGENQSETWDMVEGSLILANRNLGPWVGGQNWP